MGGVDVADQLRSYYSTQLTVFRTWVPLFFWLLDTSIINSYLISKKLNLPYNHKNFWLYLVHQLIKDTIDNCSLLEPNESTRSNNMEGGGKKKF
jgi:hypothetical protein